MSIGNKHVSHYKYFKPPLQWKRTTEGVRMPNAAAEEIFQTQKINIKILESKVIELEKQIKELKLENKDLLKANTLQEKELKKTNQGSSAIPSLMRSYKEEIRAIQSKTSSLQDQLRISENNLKIQDKAVSRKNQQIEKLTTAKRLNERQIKELNLENKELKSEKERVDKECKKLLDLKEELKLKNEELQQNVEQVTSKVSELEDSLKSAEIHNVKVEEDLNKLQKSYDELKTNFSMPKPCPALVAAETQTNDISSESNLHLTSNVGLKESKMSEVTNGVLKASGDYWVGGEYMNLKRIQEENNISSSDSICKTKFTDLRSYQTELISHLPTPKIQKSLLKPMKSRNSCPLKTHSKALGFLPIDSSISSFSVSSNFLQSNYSTKNVQPMKYFSQKMF